LPGLENVTVATAPSCRTCTNPIPGTILTAWA
jgi:hypothetical protein